MSDETVEDIKRRKLEELQSRAGNATPAEPVEITDQAHLSDLIDRHAVVLVDCYADWCGPCKQVRPIVERVAEETDAAVAAVDVDRHADLARSWNVRSIPTLLLFVDGELAERLVGVQPFDRLAELVGRHAAA